MFAVPASRICPTRAGDCGDLRQISSCLKINPDDALQRKRASGVLSRGAKFR
jgi:hypothetical protein